MKFSKKNIHKRNRKFRKTIKKKLVKINNNNKSRTKHKFKKKKLTKNKFYKFKGGTPEFEQLFIQVVSDIQEDNIDNIKSIIDQNPGLINYQMDNNKSTLLLQACLLSKPDLIKLFIEKGADVNMESNETTPLCISAFNNCFQCVKILISNGANINGTDDVKKIPLMYALSNSHGLFSMNNNEEIPTHVKTNYIELIKFLITNGSQLNHKDDYGWTSLFYAIEYGSPIQLIDFLLQNGADVTLVNNIGYSALQLACKRRSLDVVKTLFKNSNIKDTINNTDKLGETPLIEATKRNNFEIVEFLLNSGADPSIKDTNDFTALKYADFNKTKVDNDFMKLEKKNDPKIPYLAKYKEKNMLIIKLLEAKRKAQIAANLGQMGKQNNQKEIKKLQESQNLEKQITSNAEIMNKIKETNANIMAQQLIEEEEEEEKNQAAKKIKEAAKKKKKKTKAKAKDTSNPLSGIPLINESETSQEDVPSITNEQKKPSGLSENQYDPEYLKKLEDEANERFNLDTQKAMDLSLNIQKDEQEEKELLDFWQKYFGKNQESLLKLKEIIPTLMLEQNSYQLLLKIIPKYSNKFINKNHYINNVLSLLFILIGIISNQIKQKENQIYLLFKGGAAIQTVSSQLENQSYESDDLDIVIINNKNLDDISKVNENKMLVKKIGELLKWLTSIKENNQLKYILSFDTNKD